MNDNLHIALNKLMANTYTLYLKTQNYHWHVKGANFKSLHELFEEQYTQLAVAVDDIAERIVTLGGSAPATFKEFVQLASIKEGESSSTPEVMITDLHDSHQQLIDDMNDIIQAASKLQDEGTIALISERIAAHEKIRWMLSASR